MNTNKYKLMDQLRIMLMLLVLTLSGVALQAQNLIGHWLTGAADLTDTSGFTPTGTHDGFADGNPGDFLWSSDVPSGFLGMSADLTAGDVGIRVTNTVVGDANYATTFDDQILNGFSVAFWAKGFPGVWTPYVAKDGESNGFQVRRFADQGVETFSLRGTAGPDDPWGSASITDGNWHHFAAVYDGVAGTRQMYVDGVLDPAVNLTGDFGPMANPNQDPLGLGERYTGGNLTPNAYYGGKLYDVRFYNYPLTSAQVTTIKTPVVSYIAIAPTMLNIDNGATNHLTIAITVPAPPIPAYSVLITNGNPAVLTLVGAVNNVLTLNFPAGITNALTITVVGAGVGSATLSASGAGLAPFQAVVNVAAVYAPAMVGHWITGDESLADTSGYRPAGTHDGVPDAANGGAIAYSTDVPTGFTGESLDLTAGTTAVRINNTRTADAGYTNTFDEVCSKRLTVTCWIKGASIPWATFVSKNGENTGFMTRRKSVGDHETFTIPGTASGNVNPEGSVVIDDGNWHYIAGVWDGVAGTRKVFVDGAADPAINVTGDFGPWVSPSAYSVMLGARDSGGAGNYLQGLIYDVRIYNYALPAAQVISIGTPPGLPTVSNAVSKTIYQGFTATFSANVVGNPLPSIIWLKNGNVFNPAATNATLVLANVQPADAGDYSVAATNSFGGTVSSPATLTVVQKPTTSSYASQVLNYSPIGYWRFNDGEGTTAFDYAGGNNAVDPLASALQSGPQPSSFPGFESTNTAPFLDGQSQGYATTTPLLNNVANFTIMGWFNIDPNQFPFNANNPGNPQGRASLFGQNGVDELGFYQGNLLYFYGTGITQTIFVTNGFSAGQWNFVAVVSDTTAKTTTFYLNGVVAGVSGNCTGGANGQFFSIGKNVTFAPSGGVDTAFFAGSLDEVGLFNQALSASAIQSLYATATSVNTSFSLTIARQGASLQITWPVGHLESAAQINGPWSTVSGAVSPYVVAPGLGKMFYRAVNP
jgi:hypothetical protein